MAFVSIFFATIAVIGLLWIFIERRSLEREVLAVLREQRASFGRQPLTADRVTKAISIRRRNAAYNQGERNQKKLDALLRSTQYIDVHCCLRRLRDRGTVNGIAHCRDAFILAAE